MKFNKKNFYAFIRNYLNNWDTNVSGSSYQNNYLLKILWEYFRNGIAHGFVIEGGGGIGYATKFIGGVSKESREPRRMIVWITDGPS